MSSVQELINEINESRNKARQEGLTRYDTKSQKDEINIMRAMMNDKDYSVDVYGTNGIVQEQYCPAVEIRRTMSGILQNALGVTEEEANHAMNSYEFRNQDAQGMIGFSKEFINTYLQTGRKLPLGGRARSNVSLIRKTIPGGLMLYPSKVNGGSSYESQEIQIDEYDTIKGICPCPDWLKHRKEKL